MLREKGAQNGCIVAAPEISDTDAADAVARANAAPSMAGLDLAKEVSCTERYDWTASTWALGAGYRPVGETTFNVVAYDFGVKHNILRMLAERGCKVAREPIDRPSVFRDIPKRAPVHTTSAICSIDSLS